MTREKRNQATADALDRMELSDHAREIIATTDFDNLFDLFGGMGPEAVEEMIHEMDKTSGLRFYAVNKFGTVVVEAETYRDAERVMFLRYSVDEIKEEQIEIISY